MPMFKFLTEFDTLCQEKLMRLKILVLIASTGEFMHQNFNCLV